MAIDSHSHCHIDTARLRQEHPIAEVVAAYSIELRRVGAAFVGRCPFHTDGGRPNLTVYPRTGRFICFRCDARGDAISFVQQLEQISFREAAGRLGHQPDHRIHPTRWPRGRRARDDRPPGRAELAVLAAAVELYANRLRSDEPARTYLSGRGFGSEIVEAYRLGFAKGGELVPYLSWRNLPLDAARRVGLLEKDNRERLAGRIVFPEIRGGQPVWLIGRVLDDGGTGPKYLGLRGPKPLLGWDEAQRNRQSVLVVEGPMDLLALSQWKIPALALCGTGVSMNALAELRQWQRVYAMLDSDVAGRNAADRLYDQLGERVIRVELPGAVKDPADLATRTDGEQQFRAELDAAIRSHESCSAPVSAEQAR